MDYFAIIGDIVNSRKLTDRANIQKKFKFAVDKVKEEYRTSTVSPATVTIGDEFQAVLRSSSELFDLLYEMDHSLNAVPLRYGFGIGAIDTEINYLAAIGMDGPAFHHAREAVEIARKSKRRYAIRCSDKLAEDRLNILFNWIDITMKRWTVDKHAILYYYKQGYKQTEIAEMVRMSQSAVSQHINTPSFQLIIRTQEQIQREINILLGSPYES